MSRNLKNLALVALLAVSMGLAVALYYTSQRSTRAGAGGSAARNFSLLDQDGSYFELYRKKEWKAVVLVTYAIGCPIIEKNLPALEELKKEYEAKGIGFFLLDASAQDGSKQLREAARQFKISLPILRDSAQSVVSTFGFTRTSEALVIDTQGWKVLYQGAIDDRLSYGADRPAATRSYLKDALDSFLRGESVLVPRTLPNGCLIQRAEAAAAPTFNGRVAAILGKRCALCHSDKRQIRPSNLESYRDVVGWAPMIEETILTHRMPPWLPDPEYGEFTDDVTLGADEERDLLAWIRGGMPEGTGHPPGAAKPEGVLGKKLIHDFTLAYRAPEPVPASSRSHYIYSVVLENAPRDFWISGFLIKTDAKPLVHLGLVVVRQKPDFSKSGFNTMIDDDDLIFRQNVSPFKQPRKIVYHDGIAMKIPKGSTVLVEQHLDLSPTPTENDVKVIFQEYHGKKHPQELRYVMLHKTGFEIPAGARNFPVSQEWIAPRKLSLVSLMFHMHLRGTSVRAMLERPGRKPEVLYSVPNFSVNHVRISTFKTPVEIEAGSKIAITAKYDNSAFNAGNMPFDQPIPWGVNMESEEMSDMVLYYY